MMEALFITSLEVSASGIAPDVVYQKCGIQVDNRPDATQFTSRVAVRVLRQAYIIPAETLAEMLGGNHLTVLDWTSPIDGWIYITAGLVERPVLRPALMMVNNFRRQKLPLSTDTPSTATPTPQPSKLLQQILQKRSKA